MKKVNLTLVVASAVLAVGAIAAPIQAMAAEKLVIVTSYPPDTTITVGKAFTKATGIKVEMLKKKTTAGIKYLQATAANNTSDMFWASAPDAFEVLKGDGLLQKYKVKVKASRKKSVLSPLTIRKATTRVSPLPATASCGTRAI